MLHSYLHTVASHVRDAQKHFQLAMVDIEKAPLIEARYMPIRAPEVRFFQ